MCNEVELENDLQQNGGDKGVAHGLHEANAPALHRRQPTYGHDKNDQRDRTDTDRKYPVKL